MVARGGVPERLVWSLGGVLDCKYPQRLLQRWQVQVAAMAFPELPARGAVEALDAPSVVRR